MYLTNVLGGLDYLLHGNSVRGWGGGGTPDPVLLTASAFDAAARQFQYRVNPRFGRTDAAAGTINSPFRVSLNVSFNLGRSYNEQQLTRLLNPGRGGRPGVRFNADSLRRRYIRAIPDLYLAIMQQSDSLLLSRQQAEALQLEDEGYRKKMDSLWTGLAKHFASLPDNYDVKAAAIEQESAADSAWEISRFEAKKLGTILTPSQLRLLPFPAGMLYTATKPIKGMRIYVVQ
jgi:hypothetical protein